MYFGPNERSTNQECKKPIEKPNKKGSKTKVGNVHIDNDIDIDKVKINKEMFRNKFLLWEIKFWKESWK
jgi:hypothetical protein